MLTLEEFGVRDGARMLPRDEKRQKKEYVPSNSSSNIRNRVVAVPRIGKKPAGNTTNTIVPISRLAGLL